MALFFICLFLLAVLPVAATNFSWHGFKIPFCSSKDAVFGRFRLQTLWDVWSIGIFVCQFLCFLAIPDLASLWHVQEHPPFDGNQELEANVFKNWWLVLFYHFFYQKTYFFSQTRSGWMERISIRIYPRCGLCRCWSLMLYASRSAQTRHAPFKNRGFHMCSYVFICFHMFSYAFICFHVVHDALECQKRNELVPSR